MITRGIFSSLVVSLLAGSTLAQESQALFDAALVVGDTQTRFQKLADIDGDGFMDAYGGWWVSSSHAAVKVTAYINDGEGNLISAWSKDASFSSGTSVWSFDAADANADGSGDVVFGAGQSVHLILAGPGGGPSVQGATWISTGSPVTGVQFIDVDADGSLEIAVMHRSVTILRFDGSGTLSASAVLPLNASAGELRLANVDGVGGPDLLGWDLTNVYLIPMIAGIPQPPQVFAHGCATPKGMAGDIDGDGDEDVVVMAVGTYVVLRRTGSASYALEAPQVGGPARFLEDIDLDGDLDAVCCGGGGPGSPQANNNPSVFRIALNDGTGHFALAREFPGMGSERMAGAADLDLDGDMDIVAGRCIYYGQAKFLDGIPDGLPFAPPSRALADLEGDLDLDLEPGTSTLRNLGDGTLVPYEPVLPAAPPGTTWIGPGFPGDFDGDGDLDLVVQRAAGSTFEQMHLLANQGGGSFVDAGVAGAPGIDFTYSWHPGPRARDVIVADADGDDDLDLLVCGGQSPYAKLYWNDGQGFFSAGPTWTVEDGNAIHARYVVDMNGNGIPDILCYKATDGFEYISILAGLGNGTFAAGYDLVFGTSTYFSHDDVFDVGDADGDGDLDLVAVEASDASLFLNNGQPAMVPPMLTWQHLVNNAVQGSDLNTPRGAQFTEVDGDGRLDVVCWPVGKFVGDVPNGSLVLLRNEQNNGYEAPLMQILQPRGRADVDSDGDVDLLAANLHKNRAFEGADGGLRRQTHNGHPGAGGVTPTLGARGPFRVGEPVEMVLTGATGGIGGWFHQLWVSDAPPVFSQGYQNFGQRVTYAYPAPLTTSGTLGDVGAGRWSLPFEVPGYAAGRTRMYFADFQDPFSPSGRSRSNDLRITYGP